MQEYRAPCVHLDHRVTEPTSLSTEGGNSLQGNGLHPTETVVLAIECPLFLSADNSRSLNLCSYSKILFIFLGEAGTSVTSREFASCLCFSKDASCYPMPKNRCFLGFDRLSPAS